MRKFIFILFLLSVSIQSSYAFEVVYPKAQSVEINANQTFFTGHLQDNEEILKINDIEVPLSAEGGFYFPVKLNNGENTIVVESDKEKKVYNITTNNKQLSNLKDDKIHYFNETLFGIVICDNAPLRSHPVDHGINRLSHLSKEIPLKLVGESGDFYMVELSKDNCAWILKNQVKISSDIDAELVSVSNYTFIETNDKRIYKIKLSNKTPFVLSETRKYKVDESNNSFHDFSDGLDLDVYNVTGFPDNIYQLHINKIGKMCGYSIYYTSDNELILEVKNWLKQENPLNNRTITIDAGHGGEELGAIGCYGDKEKDINLLIAKKLKDDLINKGVKVVMTRDCDCDLSLEERVNISQKNNSDVFISIHNNSISDGKAFFNPHGTSVYYYYDQAAPLAELVEDELITNLQSNNDGVYQQSFAVVRNTQSPSILVEVGYMINPDDMTNLKNPDYQASVSKAITKALERYFDEL